MAENKKYWRSVVVGIALGLMVLTTTAFARNPNPGVLPPNSHAFGNTYEEWSAAWWQWVLSIPADDNPLLDQTGEKCNIGQSGKVFFLVGTAPPAPSAATRACTIPAGKAIFFPIINIENDFPCPDPNFKPAPGQSLEDFLTEGAKAVIDHVTELEVEIDGVALKNLFDYRATSPLFTFTGDPSLIIIDPCITGSPQPAVSDGYWIMLTPLPPGQHEIHFRGVENFPESNFTFETEVTYHIIVAPQKP